MTNLQQQQIQTAMRNYLKNRKLETLVKKARIGSKLITQMLAGEWREIDYDTWAKVAEVVMDKLTNGLYQTKDCKAIMNVCDRARKNRLMIGLTGDTGMGKTYVLKTITGMENTFYCELDLSISPKVFLKDLLKKMRVWYDGSLNGMLNKAAEKLNEMESPLLIIDEAGKLSHKLMLCLHTLRDRTSGNCGIVLAGMPELRTNLVKGKDMGKNGYSEFFRRVNMWEELKGLQADELKMVLADAGITDTDLQREFRRYTRFGDLVNEINLFHVLNEQTI